MGKFLSLIRRAPKRVAALVAMIVVAIIVPAALLAWGPDRQTYTMEHPADKVTFNSITNNPSVGDERNFVRIREDGTNANYGKTVALQPGKTYQVMVYYHNNAASVMNADGSGIAHDVTLRMQIPGVVNNGGTANVNGFISASNADPGTVYDTATATNNTGGAIGLDYVEGSAKVTSNGAVNGATLPNSLFTTGAKLGYDSLNGDLPGCNQYAGYVIFKFVANQPNFKVDKVARVAGTSEWKTNVQAKAGDTIEYSVGYYNTGTTDQNNVILNDYLPQGVTYIKGSSTLKNSQNPNGKSVSDNIVTSSGINIGNYAPGSNAYVSFKAKVAGKDDLKCGTNSLVNTARATTSGGYKEGTATVTVNKDCKPGQITVCELSTKKIVTINENQFDASKYSKDLSKCQETPVTPPELPQTGMTENIVAITGLGALIASIVYYVASRRALNQ